MGRVLGRVLLRLRGWTRSRMPRDMRGGAHTEDVLQDAAASVLPKIHRLHLKETGDLEAYVRQTITNQVKDRAKWRRRHPHEPIEVDRPSPEESPLDAVIRRERWMPFQPAFETLSEAEREALIARFDLGLGYNAIAELTGRCTPDAARMMVNRALDKLQAASSCATPSTPTHT
ncbi:MAG: sigma-70 family RNA polymerase sigma factor [Gemmatimonadaceae bacterium]|nr:sigma-70 family RNA polymerase sigma factor [Gemmatimonadaceae bacterium]